MKHTNRTVVVESKGCRQLDRRLDGRVACGQHEIFMRRQHRKKAVPAKIREKRIWRTLTRRFVTDSAERTISTVDDADDV